MRINENFTERIIRVIVGVVLLAVWVFGWLTGTWAVVLGIVGIILVITGAVGFCAIYALLGISTAPRGSGKV